MKVNKMNEFIQEIESLKKQLLTLHDLTTAQQVMITKLNRHQELREEWGPDGGEHYLDEFAEMYADALEDTDKETAKDIKEYVLDVIQECGLEHWEDVIKGELESRKEIANVYAKDDSIPY